MKVEIVDGQAFVWPGDTGHFVVPSREGAVGTLPGYTPFMALLMPGRVEVNLSEGRSLVFEVDGGLVTVDEGRVYVVVEYPDTRHTRQLNAGQLGVLRPGTRSKGTKGGDMRTLDIILAVAFAGASAGLVFLSIYFVRLRGLLHKYGALQCALRRKGGRQTPGVIALQADAIEWCSRRSLVLNSKWNFPRELLEIRGHRQGILSRTTAVEFPGDEVEYGVALRTVQFVGLVSWISSASPTEESASF